MLKLLAGLCVVAFAYCQGSDLENPPAPVAVVPNRIWIPQTEGTEHLQTIDTSQCNDADLYDTEEAVDEIDTEHEYVCAFIAFQVNKSPSSGVLSSGAPAYTSQEDADLRYGLFKTCVDDVNEINRAQRSWTAGVNFFCDMTQAEKDRMHGFLPPNDPQDNDSENGGAPVYAGRRRGGLLGANPGK